MRYFLIVLLLCCCENPVDNMPDKQDLDFGCPPNRYWDYDLEKCVNLPVDIPEELK